jgi:para-nitrobenzyl esterase
MVAHLVPWRRARLAAASCAALAALTIAAAGATAAQAGAVASGAARDPVVATDDGALQGATAGTVDEFLGIPYAAPPVGNLRWRPPAPAASWRGVREATQFGPSCPQAASPFAPPGPFSENCLYLNVILSFRVSRGRDLRRLAEDGVFDETGAA